MADTQYGDAFFARHDQGARDSARATIPVLFEFVRPASVVDVGCGQGTWLAAFRAAGVADYVGIDGDYLNRAKLQIEPDRFLAHDLSQPFKLDRRFDLAVSLEVAEHLPPASAETFIASLVHSAPVVMFSAAVPYQGGDGHINEQWPDYWIEIFKQHDYVAVDCLRRPLWNMPDVEPWYRQNLLLFVDRARLGDYPRLHAAYDKAGPDAPLALVHPAWYLTQHRNFRSQFRALHVQAIRAALRLRDINLTVFPDWTQPAEDLHAQMRDLLAALVAHPDRRRIALVVHLGPQPQESLGEHVRRWLADVPAGLERLAAEGPEVTAVNDGFAAHHWEVLLDSIAWRITLHRENTQALLAAGTGLLPTLPAAKIEAGQSLART